jgi:L-threonylcarbamoyladenylate synthase
MTPRIEPQDVVRLEQCVAAGGVAVFPSDTVYGVCCDPENEQAAQRLYELKGRPAARPAAVMFFALEPALAALPELPDTERRALQALLPGPVTLLFANRARRFAPACRTDPATLGLRVPQLPPALRALSSFNGAIMQSSANLSGQPAARSLEEVPDSILTGADLVLDGGELPGRPSTVVDLRDYGTSQRWQILREGALSSAEVQRRLAVLAS